MPPNVLLVVLDTARADAFEPYGAPAESSPAVAELARRGSALPRVYATGCWTVPSHASIFTGLLPRAAGLVRAPGRRPEGCKPVLEGHRERLLPEVLRRAGYATAGVSANLWITEYSGFATGFDQWETLRSARQEQLDAQSLRKRIAWAFEGLRGRADDGAAEAEQVFRRLIAERPEQPFFWFVNLVEAHSPYLPPRPYNDLSPLDRMRSAEDARRHMTLDAVWRACAGGFDVPEDALARMRHLYARSVRYADDWLARVLDAMDGRGLLENTLVIVISDHGENLGEGGLMGHAFSLDNRLTHVPVVAAGPVPFGSDDVRSLAELPRMIAEAVGLERHPWSDGELPAGVAVAQFDPPTRAEDPRVRQTVERWGLGEDVIPRVTTPLTAATDGRRKLLRRGVDEALYDLERDPLELDPVAAVGNGALQVLRDALEHPAGRVAAVDADGAVTPNADSAQIEAQMRLLGYL